MLMKHPKHESMNYKKTSSNIVLEFKQILDKRHHNKNRIKHEQTIHEFLERYPVFLPGLFDLHNGPAGGIIISKIRLVDFEPDFVFATQHSGHVQFTLIEIEDPCKSIFTQNHSFTSKFRDALQQSKDWLGARDQISYRLQRIFGSAIDFQCSDGSPKPVQVKAYLVFGRRHQVNHRKRSERWSAEIDIHEGIKVLTFDRLLPPHSFAAAVLSLQNSGLGTYAYRNRELVKKFPESVRGSEF